MADRDPAGAGLWPSIGVGVGALLLTAPIVSLVVNASATLERTRLLAPGDPLHLQAAADARLHTQVGLLLALAGLLTLIVSLGRRRSSTTDRAGD